ncbi:fused response regulator/phosphatase [Azospirillum griseum]|uniref:Response regulator n=1 Tax=Azospirillum griseum TaxID=2496639 RepID=A0A3S0HYJ8_9PROT|nr:fused response regulator/phosphatase [Azospirillum griseum]RTR17397.1 response regulator [Azospirillum griseum]
MTPLTLDPESDLAADVGAGLPDCPILIVDDTHLNRTLIGAILSEAGFHNLHYARDGQEALDLVAARQPDLVILDIMMPGIDGFEVCRRLRADPETADLPILVQTSLTSGEDRNRAFVAGTTDLVSKPLDRSELVARVRIHLESRVLIRHLQSFRARVEGELAIARSMHEHLLPSPTLCNTLGSLAGVVLRAHTEISANLGGDLWGVLPLDDGRLGIFLLNMSGQGVSAAMNAFRLHTLLHELTVDHGLDPAAMLTALNRQAVGLLEDGQHATAIYGVIDGERGSFTYAAAESAPPFLLPPNGEPPVYGGTGGMAIGMNSGTRYHSDTLPLAPGAVLALYSVAVLQSLNEGGVGVGLGWMIAGAMSEGGGDEGFSRVVNALRAALGHASGDDHTLVWIERRGP